MLAYDIKSYEKIVDIFGKHMSEKEKQEIISHAKEQLESKEGSFYAFFAELKKIQIPGDKFQIPISK